MDELMTRNGMSTAKEHKDPELREALDALMELRQITSLKEIAQKADCALSHLSSTYRGEASMSATLIRRICQAFELDRSEFFRMGEMRHRLNCELAERFGNGEGEKALRRLLEALIAQDPDRARRLLDEFQEQADRVAKANAVASEN